MGGMSLNGGKINGKAGERGKKGRTPPGQPAVHGRIEPVSLEELAKSAVEDLPELVDGNKRLKEQEKQQTKLRAAQQQRAAQQTGGTTPAGTTDATKPTTPSGMEARVKTAEDAAKPKPPEDASDDPAKKTMVQTAKKAAEDFLKKSTQAGAATDAEDEKRRLEKRRMMVRLESQAQQRMQELESELEHILQDEADLKAGADPEEIAERAEEGDASSVVSPPGEQRRTTGPDSELLRGQKDEILTPDYEKETFRDTAPRESRHDVDPGGAPPGDHRAATTIKPTQRPQTDAAETEQIRPPTKISRQELVKQLAKQEREIDFLNDIVTQQGDLLFDQLKLLSSLREGNELSTIGLTDEVEGLRQVIFDNNLRLLEGMTAFGSGLKEIETTFSEGCDAGGEGQQAVGRGEGGFFSFCYVGGKSSSDSEPPHH